jgi:hypothetical protein
MRYFTLLLTTVSFLVGSVPQNLSYQGFIKASDGSLLPDGSYTVTFRIYEEVTGGVSLWSEEHEIYLKAGMISATLGESTSFTFSTKMNYLELQVNGDVMTPRQKMTSVTYAFHAESAQKIATDSTTYTFPLEDGTSGQSLTTDGSGSLSWTTVDGGSSSATSLSATGDATGSGVLKLYEDTDDGTNYAGLKAGTMASDVTWTLPTAHGTSGQSITTDGLGTLSWTSEGAFSTMTASGAVTANANLSVKNGATGAGTVILYEDSDDGSNYAGLKAGTMASDVTWTLPTADGTSGQVISTDGSGALSWSSVSGGSLINATTTIGTGSADAKLASSGEHDLILQTGNATTGTITITDGANGNIAVTPNGTGEVDISKVDIDGGAIDGTAIGASSASTGAFSTVTASGAVTANANLSVKNGATSAGTVTLYEDSDDGSNYAGLKAGTMASDVTWTLPTADGTSGQVISTDGSGALSWSSVSGGSLTNATTSIGTGSATANLASDGDYDLVLKTGNSTTGSITITDGANGNITVTPNGTGQVDIGTDLTVTGNDITFGNGETISNATDGDFLFTTGTASGALTLKNSNGSDGIAAIELVSDAGAEVGDAYELQSLNGSFTITSDHTTKGTYDDTYLTIAGNATPASSTTTIAGDLTVSGDVNSSGAVYRNVTDKTSNYTVTSTDGLHVITNSNGASGNITITLPDPTDAANLGRELIFQPTNYGDIIITTHDGSNLIATVDGVQSTYTLIYFAYSVTLLCNGTYWTATGTSEDGSL